MSAPPPKAGPDLPALFALFPPDDVTSFEYVVAAEVPEPHHGLLVHEHHMTVTVEAFHGGPVNVRVLDRKLTGEFYARKILLTMQRSGKVVLYWHSAASTSATARRKCGRRSNRKRRRWAGC